MNSAAREKVAGLTILQESWSEEEQRTVGSLKTNWTNAHYLPGRQKSKLSTLGIDQCNLFTAVNYDILAIITVAQTKVAQCEFIFQSIQGTCGQGRREALPSSCCHNLATTPLYNIFGPEINGKLQILEYLQSMSWEVSGCFFVILTGPVTHGI